MPEAIGSIKLPGRQSIGSSYKCCDLKGFFAGMRSNSLPPVYENLRVSRPATLCDSRVLEAYIAGSAKRKLSLAGSSKSIRSSSSSVLVGTILKGPRLLLPPALLAESSATKLECTRKPRRTSSTGWDSIRDGDFQ